MSTWQLSVYSRDPIALSKYDTLICWKFPDNRTKEPAVSFSAAYHFARVAKKLQIQIGTGNSASTHLMAISQAGPREDNPQ
jgi:hypothetical protein